ncbi:diguanylate cyclase domain-containing protein [Roseateles toxinivorans]|uniref:diguanylate cyclase n=1 Tax=Roseateles toxinivorans TaxID=270368 RepID=A0A4V3CT91_9BURK|nr:GGDEF domain-containing protein [Roseateles toxinivorans]TDP63824.1 two-component system cell cycle response regulator [Roseateles toxinivorans]
MDTTRVVWVATSDTGAELAPLLEALGALGLSARSCLPGDSWQLKAELRVLPAYAFAGPDELQAEYLQDTRPTLVLTSAEAQELSVLGYLSEHDDLAPFTPRADLLALRLERLARRASQVKRAAPPQTDALTGLPNRERFDAELTQCLVNLSADVHKAAVFLDLDQFSQVNEQYGRLGGDLVLVQMAMLLGSELAPSDLLARVGADKFVCLLSRYDRATLLADARLLVQRIAQHQFMIDAHAAEGAAPTHLSLTASAGLAFLAPGAPAPELWRQLDVAVFEAKTAGRNRLEVYAAPVGIRPLGSTPQEQAQLQHLLNVTKVVSERMDQLLKPVGPNAGDAVLRESYQDPLTQLNNRRYFDLRLEREFGSARKHGRPLSLAWMDISHLHDLNQRYGWAAGDKALQHFAELAQGSIRLVDWLARVSGQEFCLVMPDTDLAEGRQVAERIRAKLQAGTLNAPDGRPVTLTLSLGVAQIDDALQQPEELIALAQSALRHDKAGA